MAYLNYRRLEIELQWGCRLYWERMRHRQYWQFLGNCKGSGFKAYLEAEGIPRRKAYRLIQRYLRMREIMNRIDAADATFEPEVCPLPAPEALEKLQAEFKAICDGDR